MDSETLEHCSFDGDSEVNQKVPKSASSSSGVNEISDSSNNSTDEYNKRMEEVAEREKSGDIPTFRDVMDLLKFSYILQVKCHSFMFLEPVFALIPPIPSMCFKNHFLGFFLFVCPHLHHDSNFFSYDSQ